MNSDRPLGSSSTAGVLQDFALCVLESETYSFDREIGNCPPSECLQGDTLTPLLHGLCKGKFSRAAGSSHVATLRTSFELTIKKS